MTQKIDQYRNYADQKITVNTIINFLRGDLKSDDLRQLRRNSLYLVDVLFPSGFSYTANVGSSELVTGGEMRGE